MYLVTGGTGLIGSHLILDLLKNGHQVKAIYRKEERIENVKKLFGYYANDAEQWLKKINWVQADINDVVSLENAFEGTTHVYHCAALISFDPKDYRQLKKCNVEGTQNIVNLCLKYKVKKLCHVSSIAALGTSLKDKWIDEKTEWIDKHANVYGLTKKNAELQVWRASQEGLPMVIVNPGVVLGPGFWKSGSGTLFYYAAKGNTYSLPGGTGFIAVHDVVASMMQLMDSTIKNKRFVLVDENTTYLDIMQRISGSMEILQPTKVFNRRKIELFWRLDWVRSSLFKKRRRLTKNMARSLFKQEFYDAGKIKKALSMEFSDLNTTIDFCSTRFKEDFPKLF